MISSYVAENHSTWDVHLQKFALALRSVSNDSTKVSPARLNLGREIQLPFDRALQDNDTAVDTAELNLEITKLLLELVNFVRKNMSEAQKTNKIVYDKSRREVKYTENQLVLVRNHTISSKVDGIAKKLAPKWIGPYVIRKRITPVTYSVLSFPDKIPAGPDTSSI